MQTDDRTSYLWLTLVYALGLGVASALCRLVPYYFHDPSSGDFMNLAPMGALALPAYVSTHLATQGAPLRPHRVEVVPGDRLSPLRGRRLCEAIAGVRAPWPLDTIVCRQKAIQSSRN